jgi:hypothetical protein
MNYLFPMFQFCIYCEKIGLGATFSQTHLVTLHVCSEPERVKFKYAGNFEKMAFQSWQGMPLR